MSNGTSRPPTIRRRYVSPERIREIGADYGVKLSGTMNTRPLAVIVLMLTASFLYLLLALIFSFFNILGMIDRLTVLQLAFVFWSPAIGFVIWKFFLVIVPKYAGLYTINVFGGEVHVYSTGWHLKLPWETYSAENVISVRAQLVSKPESNPSKFVTKDGVAQVFRWTEQYGVYLPMLGLYVRTEEHAIAHGLEEVVEHAIQEVVVARNVNEILNTDVVDLVIENIGHKLQTETDKMGNTIEDRFGITVELSTIGPPEFDQDYKEALNARVIRAVIEKDAQELASTLGISGKDALQTVMILNKEAVQKNIITLEADEQIAAMGQAIASALQTINNNPGLANTLQGMLRLFQQGGGGRRGNQSGGGGRRTRGRNPAKAAGGGP